MEKKVNEKQELCESEYDQEIRKMVRASLDDLIVHNFQGGTPYEEVMRKINEKIKKYEKQHSIQTRS